jgi:hypothetical protein
MKSVNFFLVEVLCGYGFEAFHLGCEGGIKCPMPSFSHLKDKLLCMIPNLQHPKNRIKLQAHYKPILPNFHQHLFLCGENYEKTLV